MAITASMSVMCGDYEPRAEVLTLGPGTCSPGGRFITVKFDDGYGSIILPGLDAAAAAYARKLAATLLEAADRAEAAPAPADEPAVVEV